MVVSVRTVYQFPSRISSMLQNRQLTQKLHLVYNIQKLMVCLDPLNSEETGMSENQGIQRELLFSDRHGTLPCIFPKSRNSDGILSDDCKKVTFHSVGLFGIVFCFFF